MTLDGSPNALALPGAMLPEDCPPPCEKPPAALDAPALACSAVIRSLRMRSISFQRSCNSLGTCRACVATGALAPLVFGLVWAVSLPLPLVTMVPDCEEAAQCPFIHTNLADGCGWFAGAADAEANGDGDGVAEVGVGSTHTAPSFGISADTVSAAPPAIPWACANCCAGEPPLPLSSPPRDTTV